ncbi:MAG: hypothetical protein JW918_04925 [Anaerolineae bacterium]|nr:hypothetical protein [Anaerolineae bacterium]
MTTIANAFFKVLEFFDQRKWAILVLGIILGLVVGLLYMQSYLGGLRWTNAGPDELRWDFREDYLLWVARNYQAQSLANSEWARYKLLGVDYDYNDPASKRKPAEVKTYAERVAAALDSLAEKCQSGQDPSLCSSDDATRLSNLSADIKTVASDQPQSKNFLQTVWGYLKQVCLVGLILLIVLGGGFLLYRWWRGRQEEQEVREAIAERARPVTPTAAWGMEGAPLAQFPTTYVLGDDHFDPSFSIELDSGEFMGECGVGVSENIGVGAPNKVTAFEVWLFDKSDIRTVTKVVMSDYAFNDEALRTKLAPKGEPVAAREGAEVTLETKTLRIKARIVEAKYGIGNLPQSSFFERLSIDLAVWVKAVPEGGEAFEDDIATILPNEM